MMAPAEWYACMLTGAACAALCATDAADEISISQLFILLNLYQYIFHILKISHFTTPALALNMEPLASQANALPLGYPAMLNDR